MRFWEPVQNLVRDVRDPAPSGEPAEVEPSQLEELGRQMQTGMENFQQALDNVFGMVSRACDELPGIIRDQVNRQIEILKLQGETFLSVCRDMLMAVGFPGAATLGAWHWVNDVRNPVRSVVGQLEQSQRFVQADWKGRARAAYDGAVGAQLAAMREVVAIVEDLRNLLLAVAAAITAFYVALGVAIIEAVAALEVGGSIVAIVRSLMEIARKITTSVDKVVKLIAAVGAVVGPQFAAFFDLNNRIATNEAFPDGRWPESKASALSDASWQDGDASDWRLNYG
ncbi:hypothetical protein GCM10027569_02190 [Flindersiella endophytica]